MSHGADLVGRQHQRASVLLRRWLAETHTPVAEGPLRLTIGSLSLHVDVVYDSPTGAHGFGSIGVLDAEGRTLVSADPALLAAACSADARARSRAEAPINRPESGTLVDWLLDALPRREVDPLPLRDDLVAVGRQLSNAAEAQRWLTRHVEERLLPEVLAFDGTDRGGLTARLLSRGVLVVIGLLGRRGVVHEEYLLAELAKRLGGIAEQHSQVAELVEHWLTSPTLTDLAALNGSQLRYRDETGAVRVRPVPFEHRNPLRLDQPADVPGVPLPELGEGWSLRPVAITGEDGGADVALVHRWMNREHVAVNWNQDWPLERWRDELATQLAGEHSVPCVVARDGRDIGYLELYRVQRDKLARCYSHAPHDLGAHIAIGEPDAIGKGVGSELLGAVARGLLAADPACRNVVAEPNVHNGASVGAFGKAGFAHAAEVGLPNKNSALMVFARPGE
ncbi:GNAT family N-acetyltransferase [Saccharopolyspora sp. TS4A08]|uniref:Lysine N-acyltransferase MbtK n=1 Tax=Saccharopolyspora ipomoeae TaxID=3042027 RepID=A0ABT6PSB6_9PSEU|nr:GNAT family N-acetyltransferase [Saccharopolyspora sp. TS4A08]MDI2030899.1 GNAT family N-acetyltransferase [Saccharopolyspora sp. TS4A08]